MATVQFSEYGLRDVDFVTGGHKTTYTFFVTPRSPRAMIDSHAQFVVEHPTGKPTHRTLATMAS